MPRPYAMCITGDLPVVDTFPKLVPHFHWVQFPSWELASGYVSDFREGLGCIVVSLSPTVHLETLAEIRKQHPKVSLYVIVSPGQEFLGYQVLKSGMVKHDHVLSWPFEEAEWRIAFKSCEKCSWWGRIQHLFPFATSVKANNAIKERIEPESSSPPSFSLPVQGIPILEDERESESGYEAVLRVSLLGEFSMAYNGNHVEHLPNRKLLSIWAYLLVNGKRPVCRDTLMEIFWKGVGRNSAKNSLHNAISSLRKYLKNLDPDQEFILLKQDCYSLSPRIQFLTDLDTFSTALKEGKLCEQRNEVEAALTQYRYAYQAYMGPFFEQNQQDDWVVEENAHLSENYKLLLDRMSRYYSNNGKPDLAIGYCREILQMDDCREDIHRRIMRCYFRLQMRDQALRQLDQCKSILKEEFGSEYRLSPETLKLAETIHQGYEN